MTAVAFVDTETTGLYPHFGAEVWECAVIQADHQPGRLVITDEWVAQREPHRLDLADPAALRIGRYWERRSTPLDDDTFAHEVESRTRGRVLVGVAPNFDAAFLTALLHQQHLPVGWHQLVDVLALTAGSLTAAVDPVELAQPPWRSEPLLAAVGAAPPVVERHTALGDARWALHAYCAVYRLEIT